MSREAAFRSTDDWKDTTMLTEAAACAAVIGLDVGKFSHWACHVTRQGEVLRSGPVANTEHDLDGLFAQAEAGTLVVVDAGKAAVGAVTRGANRARIDAAVAAAAASTRPSEYRVMAENPQVKVLARRIRESAEEAARLDAETTALLAGDETYACLLIIPGIGPRTASELVTSIDIGDFPDHDHLASYCGIAPRNRQSGRSISSVSSSRQGNKRLKNLLIFSCNSLSRSKGRFGDYYRSCRERGMRHGEALKAVARKRLKVTYAIMRDKVPYSA